ncbi:MAG: prepilin-type N-terminal cleavage/methylation domain-containing protein, partial [Moraxellaceae bacterium]
MPVTAKTQSSSAAVSHLSLVHPCSVYHQADVEQILHVNYSPFLQSIHRSSTDIFPTNFDASNRPHAQSGFTLVEIIVVVVILSVFAGMMSLSVGSSESRKNRAFYEHLTDSLSYVRLLSSERAQPMGLSLQANNQGQITPVIVTLSNP